MAGMKTICVIGSFNIDIISGVDDFPSVGETVFTRSFDLFVGGGKGANQAVALGRLGADVRMVGMLGDRFYGPEYLDVLRANNVRSDSVEIVPGAFPGAAFVAVDRNGDNILFVHSGANLLVSIGFIEKHWDRIAACDIFLLQLEIPYETNLFAARELSRLGKTVILDPAPARRYTDEIFPYVDFATPNEVELAQLAGVAVAGEESISRAAGILLNRGVKTVIAKVGKRGAYIVSGTGSSHVPAYEVHAVDPTAAGDSFNAGFALALAEGRAVPECVDFANAVAGLSTTSMGAQSAMPARDQVVEFLKTARRRP
jgi:ribokinase